MRVLFVLSELGTGGAAVVHRLLADRLTRMGVQADVFSYNKIGWENIFGTYPRERIIFQEDMTLTQLLCQRDYDIIHGASDTPDRGLERSLKLSQSQAAVVLTCHGFEVPNRSVDFVNVMVTVSRSMEQGLRQKLQIPLRTVYNGINEELFKLQASTQHERPIVLWVGRPYDVRKDVIGITALASAMINDDVDIWIAAAYPHDYQFTLAEWLPERVRILHNLSQEEMCGVYRSAAASGGCTVSTSISEGLSMSVLESMACGCPVAAPAIGGMVDFLNERNGVLYSRPISASNLRKMVLDLITDTSRRESIISEGLKTVVSEFTAAKMTERYYDLYCELLAKAPRRRNLISRVKRRFTGTLSKLKS